MPDFPLPAPTVSFDVFDTVLTRNVYRPHDLFLRIQVRLTRALPGELPEELCRDYRNIRIAAESTAREQLAAREEVTLREILSVIARRFQLSEKATVTLEEMEVGEELASVGPVGQAALLLRGARSRGWSINYVSDMYLSDEVIAAMLTKVQLLEPTDGLFVSGGRGRRKSSGTLFREVLGELRIGPGDLCHVGDYLVSDYLVPRKLGIKAFPLRSARSNADEALLGERCGCLYCSSVAGASRAARAAGEEAGQEGALFKLGCNVLGPVLAGFALWTLQQARQAGLRRLYFLSRDGEIILEVASALAARLGIEMELRYLHVSRTAVFPALLGTGVEAGTLGWLTEPTIVPTVRIFADRLRIEPDRLCQGLLTAGAPLQGLDTPLDAGSAELIASLLVSDPDLKEMVGASGRRAMATLGGYLEQEAFFDATPSGVVDLGWHGTIQDVIHTCFADRLGAHGLAGFYFGVDLPSEPGNGKYGYFVDHQADGLQRFRHLFRVLIELLCSGSHGMVRRHEQSVDGRYAAVLSETEHSGNWERTRSVRRGCLAFLDRLDVSSLGVVDYRHIRPQILDVFRRLFFFPTSDEALALGGFWFSADQAGHGLHEVAPPFVSGSALRYLAGRSYAARSAVSSWFFASWARSGWCIRLMLLPLVQCLRAYYCAGDLPRFVRLLCAERVNRALNTARFPSAGGDHG